ncbi:DUF2946 domain-containing protein [Verminephrobacter aporrectodeae subsp. tuberculatae]|nr:DUF2946 domain-containing protein [Verminephrobacter aporrectodeae subsp. tuberculatae]MCW8202928.1 DUF2946 domain-containing protein [Verminephrobacter aporrectodeae subsp. tuberculatae]MCW8206701.1 DUF2946 domain-containing protein [Verminephrobacter aporrectodeae subsp. tuberculatae]
MSPMQTIRHARWLARLVLAWFVLSIGVAVASPLVKPRSMELICSGSGAITLLTQTADGTQEISNHHTLDCPLCVHAGAPPSRPASGQPVVYPRAQTLRALPAAHIAARTAAPLPPRGPPTHS